MDSISQSCLEMRQLLNALEIIRRELARANPEDAQLLKQILRNLG